mmetsp:Transcript_34779/g.48216  ORF Transcript_34779/g.48216 Transcript_34779/m.48216 type:complete len:250 (-) Transcript_34779:1342-2091(-)
MTLGSPLRALCTPVILNSPSRLFPSVWERSPSKTRMSISVCQSATVVNSEDFLHGMEVLRGTTLAKCLPSHSTPRDRGITSTSSKDCVEGSLTPARMAPCTAAPNATASSGCTDLHSALPPKNSCKIACTRGTRVDPPTKIISSTTSLATAASLSTDLTDSRHFWHKDSHSFSNLARVSSRSISSSPIVHWMRAVEEKESWRLAISQAARILRCALALSAYLSSLAPLLRFNSVVTQSATMESKSSPPR